MSEKQMNIMRVAVLFCLYAATGCIGSTDSLPSDGEVPLAMTCEERKASIESIVGAAVAVTCNQDDTMSLTSATGLPSHEVMHGIENWINRLPVPYPLTFVIPMSPDWTEGYSNTTGIGPNAFAINGVPIFHYSTAPSPSIDPTADMSDTVTAHELDACGGHSGQGEDYHYHQAPICLVDTDKLSEPIAYSIDGSPVYFGGAPASDKLDELELDGYSAPAGLDICNATQADDGGWAFYTTADQPYVVGCHHTASIDNTGLNVPSFQGRGQGQSDVFGNIYGEVPADMEPMPATQVVTEGVHYIQEFTQAGAARSISYVVSTSGETQEITATFIDSDGTESEVSHSRPTGGQ